MTPRYRSAAVALLALAAIGCVDSVYLLAEHALVRATGTSLGACDVNARINCAAAALSSYAELYGIPIAGIGLAYYVGIAVLVGMAWTSSERRSVIVPFLVIASALATGYSAFLLFISLTFLSAICPACSVTYAVNVLSLGAALYWATPGLGESMRSLERKLAELITPLAAFALVLFVVTAGSAIWTQYRMATPPVVAPGEPTTPQKPTLAAAEITTLARAPHAPAMGPASANVVIVVFSDFECPHCARFAATLRRLHRNYGDALRVEYRNYPLPMHKGAEMAARLGVCAEKQHKFWGFHDLCFEKQEALSPSTLPGIVDDAGVDVRAAMACAETDEVRQIVAADIAAGENLGIEGTPAFVLNGELTVGAVIYDDLERRIGKLLQSTERVQLAP